MKKILELKNGIAVLADERAANSFSISATVNVGHVNEPSLGIAALYEKVLALQAPSILTVYGGTMTSFLTGCSKKYLGNAIAQMAELFVYSLLNKEQIRIAAEDIVKHTLDMAPLPQRQMKLLYKHTAFRTTPTVWDTEAYIDAIRSYTPQQLRDFAAKYYTGSNLVLVVSGPIDENRLMDYAEECFGDLPQGEKIAARKEMYTGGYAELPAIGDHQQVMFGWDVSYLQDAAEANVMMSMLAGRLERSFAGKPVDIEVKIAGYYGRRTLRISAISRDENGINGAIDTICANVVRLFSTLASDRRMETSRNRAMCEKLFQFSQPQDRSIEKAWQFLGRGQAYDVNEYINNTWRVCDYDVRDVAKEIFASPLTLVLTSGKPHYAPEEIVAKLAPTILG